jgi:hypothetical protein
MYAPKNQNDYTIISLSLSLARWTTDQPAHFLKIKRATRSIYMNIYMYMLYLLHAKLSAFRAITYFINRKPNYITK